jgi:predicted DCC family thiol-disulfide oxidoreductase YuxK
LQPHTADNDRSFAEVFYDGDCQFCVNTARRFERVLERNRFKLVALQTPETCARLGILDHQLTEEMRLRLPDGTVFGGADAIAQVARHIWWAWPLWALSRLPGAARLARGTYRWFARNRNCRGAVCGVDERVAFRPISLLPLLLFPTITLLLRSRVAPWHFMWMMAFALYVGCKWLTYREAQSHNRAADRLRALDYLFTWPGMDAEAFLSASERPNMPSLLEWIAATLKTLLGATLVWVVARIALPDHPLVAGWIGMTGLVLLLHFGTFALLSLAWRSVGVNAVPIMRAPLRSISLAEFWGRRWNTAFHEIAARFTFRPLRRTVGATVATMLVFLVSGLIHELVISTPAHGGYGLPTGYFLIQAFGIAGERSQHGRRIGLGQGLRGRSFTLLVTAGPAFWLFSPTFVRSVILPMLAAAGAL